MCFASNLQVTYGAPSYRLSLLRRTFSLIKLHVIGLVKTKFKLFSAFKSLQSAFLVYLFHFGVQRQLHGHIRGLCPLCCFRSTQCPYFLQEVLWSKYLYLNFLGIQTCYDTWSICSIFKKKTSFLRSKELVCAALVSSLCCLVYIYKLCRPCGSISSFPSLADA